MQPHFNTTESARMTVSRKSRTPPFRWATHVALCGALMLGGCVGDTDSTGTNAELTGAFFARATPSTDSSLAKPLREMLQATTATSGRTPTPTELLDWAELTFPSLFPRTPTQAVNQTWTTYVYRLYPGTDWALGINTLDNSVLAVTQFTTATPQNIAVGHIGDYSCLVFPADCHPSVSDQPLAQRAGALASFLGKPKRLLVGLGDTDLADVIAQNIRIDIKDRYLTNVNVDGQYSWDRWGTGGGDYVTEVARDADAAGAIPMYTLYQMATWGDGNIFGLGHARFMTPYWDNVRLMFQKIKLYGKPVLVNLEPDLWGYAQQDRLLSGTTDATRQPALVKSVNPDCAHLTDTVASMGQCLVHMARTLAPNAYVGFPPAGWPGLDTDNEIAYLKQVGADTADFVIMQTLDRDAGCFEANYNGEDAMCTRESNTPYWWDATNQTTPNFTQEFAIARRFHDGLQLPLIWWQTPLGVPSDTPGGTKGAFRDNRVQYFLTRAQELVNAGSVAVVFSAGHPTQTNITSDGGQFKRLSTQYLAAPAALP